MTFEITGQETITITMQELIAYQASVDNCELFRKQLEEKEGVILSLDLQKAKEEGFEYTMEYLDDIPRILSDDIGKYIPKRYFVIKKVRRD